MKMAVLRPSKRAKAPLEPETMNRKAFTLIELLVVVVIIGILAAVGIPKFANSKSKAYVTAMRSDLRNLLNAEESFFADSAKYTSNLTSLGFKASTGVNAPIILAFPGAWTATNGHTQMPTAQCGIGVNTTNPILSGAGDGEPACQ
jgi:prepilin-type N-terminal cleavage/methylation domain-containing protein